MKLMIQTAMIFFGTLMAAGVVALGEPAGARLAVKPAPASAPALATMGGTGNDMATAPRR